MARSILYMTRHGWLAAKLYFIKTGQGPGVAPSLVVLDLSLCWWAPRHPMNKRKMWRGGGNIPTKECITLNLPSSMFMSSFSSSYIGVEAAFPLGEDEGVTF